LAAWLATPAGARVLAEETPVLADAVRRSHGDTLLWLGCPDAMSRAVRGCMVRSRMFGSALPRAGMADVPSLQCEPEHLPLPNNSLDALVLHHALEATRDPRRALREAARVIVPGGRLVICAFNPLSLWGVRRLYARVWHDSFKGLHLLTAIRLSDWLAVLGFERHDPVSYVHYGLPFMRGTGPPRENSLQRLLKRHGVPVGGVFVVSTTKQALAVRPERRPARLPANLAAAYPKTAFRESNVIRMDAFRLRVPRAE
jgi:SAM-dependent methyltransferase